MSYKLLMKALCQLLDGLTVGRKLASISHHIGKGRKNKAGVSKVLERVSARRKLLEVVIKINLPATDHALVEHLPYLRFCLPVREFLQIIRLHFLT